jgi:hypothetical protein
LKHTAETSKSTTPTQEAPVAAAKDPDFDREVQVSRKSTGERSRNQHPRIKTGIKEKFTC